MTIAGIIAVVISVSDKGCEVAINGGKSWLTWDQIDEAANQDDWAVAANRGLSVDDTTRELAKIYRSIREQCRKKVENNKSLPITYTIHQDGTNVWWVATFSDVMGYGDWIDRAADEGGTLPNHRCARIEGDARAERLRRAGYVVREAIG